MELLNKTINPGASDVLEFNYAGAVTGKLTSFKITKNEGVLLSITSDKSEAVTFETGKIVVHLSAAETKLLQSVNTDNDLSYSLIIMLNDEPHTREVLYTGSILTGAAAPEQVVKIDELFYINKAVRDAQPKMLSAVIVSNGTQAPSTINIISNTTGYNFTVQRSDVGVIDLISDTPCFHTVPHHNFTCLIHPNSETDFLGSQIGFSPHTQNILHINMLHPAITQEGYADIPGDIHINIIFKD